jgi:hypothetical protein
MPVCYDDIIGYQKTGADPIHAGGMIRYFDSSHTCDVFFDARPHCWSIQNSP